SIQGERHALYGGGIFFFDGFSLEHAQFHLFDMFSGSLAIHTLFRTPNDFRGVKSEHSCHRRIHVGVFEMTILHKNEISCPIKERSEKILIETSGLFSPLALSNIKIRAR